jgi:DNA-3-methyladenine glycosylase II
MHYKIHLQKDKKIAPLLDNSTHTLEFKKNIPIRLIASIMGQQLNVKVAKIIYDRFINLYNGKDPKLTDIINTNHETLRSIGLSNAKVNYVKNVASFCLENKITDKKLLALNNAEIIDLLTQIKGVGKWTVEMLLMFSLQREDIFSVDDLGIQQAMCKLYNIDATNKKEMKANMLEIAQKYSPYSTYACLHLWAFKDNK